MSQQATLSNAPDLSKSFPASPNAMLGPFILAPRILDKCRAVLAGTQGEYKYACPLDQRFFNFTGIDPDAFKAEVAQGKNNEEMLAWIQAHARPLTEEDINAWIFQSRWARPETPERMAYFEALRQEAAPNKPYVETWFQLLDAEEGRF